MKLSALAEEMKPAARIALARGMLYHHVSELFSQAYRGVSNQPLQIPEMGAGIAAASAHGLTPRQATKAFMLVFIAEAMELHGNNIKKTASKLLVGRRYLTQLLAGTLKKRPPKVNPKPRGVPGPAWAREGKTAAQVLGEREL